MFQPRRGLIKFALSSTAASLFPQAIRQTSVSAQPDTLPVGSRGKSYPDGSVHPLTGNTVISHLPALRNASQPSSEAQKSPMPLNSI